jgi:hypothetical protein
MTQLRHPNDLTIKSYLNTVYVWMNVLWCVAPGPTIDRVYKQAMYILDLTASRDAEIGISPEMSPGSSEERWTLPDDLHTRIDQHPNTARHPVQTAMPVQNNITPRVTFVSDGTFVGPVPSSKRSFGNTP